ncbi:type II toxin-antitoxin system Phd/YefM family antitoxin [Candidatus Roizmanbacteria bacterium]|nr:type II toxin-antitoxin system Phd/YefM family antitoxin [Candidatus Roizmanbacteria bacterium]
MNLLPVGEFKAKFSEVLQKVQQGSSFGITYGKGKKKVAVLTPYKKYVSKTKFKLGLLVGKASFKLHDDFKMTDEEFLNS